MWVFKCFLSIIYLILYLKSAIVLLFQQFRRLYFSVVSQPCSFGKIREDSKGLTKLPRHISFVVLESHISFADVAQLVVWSMAMGIPFISVYDRQGVLKRKTAAFSSEIIQKQKEVFKEESNKYTFVLRTTDVKFDNDSLAPTQVCISLLSELDGKGDIIEASREFCKGIQTKRRAIKEMEPEFFNDLLKATHGIPDPDLAFKFGDVQMMMGFLPWQTRLTEFLPLRTHVNINYDTYISSLQRFGKCQQRFGK
ncbi:dehydrodolichyl diphosphate synthase complex subunit Nus1-like [Montipora foliosa]|uniref:dehydrodolichyl diphosphate synthase complex subunit Nus1-like n=1 Tax=Montipora foliosa TaxID=591990 RepID=UPI0035F187EC